MIRQFICRCTVFSVLLILCACRSVRTVLVTDEDGSILSGCYILAEEQNINPGNRIIVAESDPHGEASFHVMGLVRYSAVKPGYGVSFIHSADDYVWIRLFPEGGKKSIAPGIQRNFSALHYADVTNRQLLEQFIRCADGAEITYVGNITAVPAPGNDE